MSQTPIVKTHKIGLNRGRRRIWLDGKNLTAAGFTGGASYTCIAERGSICCRLDEPGDRLPNAPPPEGTLVQTRTVSGRPDGKPIIDITGKTVDHAFPTAATVQVTFSAGEIQIAPAP